jgi:3-hydroxyisobutyrate dehydrogenase-like beta-hydroxyacid dehydrogenase
VAGVVGFIGLGNMGRPMALNLAGMTASRTDRGALLHFSSGVDAVIWAPRIVAGSRRAA